MEPKNGIYRHYKGKDYEVIGVARNKETQEDLVIYRALYDDFQLWARPRQAFLENIRLDSEEVPRFRLLKRNDNSNELTTYIEMSPELVNLLQQKNISFDNIVFQSNQDVDLFFQPLNFFNDEARSKDIVPVIVASSAALSAVFLCLSNLLTTYFNRPHFYEWDELEEIYDSGGRILKDDAGNPIWKIKRHHKVIYPEQLKKIHSLEFNSGIVGMVLRIFSSEEKTPDESDNI